MTVHDHPRKRMPFLFACPGDQPALIAELLQRLLKMIFNPAYRIDVMTVKLRRCPAQFIFGIEEAIDDQAFDHRPD